MSFTNTPGGCCCVVGLFDWYEAGTSVTDVPENYLRNFDYIWRGTSVKPENTIGGELNSLSEDWFIDIDAPPDPLRPPDDPLRAKHKGYHGTIMSEANHVYCARFNIHRPTDRGIVVTHEANPWHDTPYDVSMESYTEQTWTGWTAGPDVELGGDKGDTWIGTDRDDTDVPTQDAWARESFDPPLIVHEFRTILRADTAKFVRISIKVVGGIDDGEELIVWFNASDGTTSSFPVKWTGSVTRVHPDHYELLIENVEPIPYDSEWPDDEVVLGVDLRYSTVTVEYLIVDAMVSHVYANTSEAGLYIDWHSGKQPTSPEIDYVLYQASPHELVGHYMANLAQQVTYAYPKTPTDRNINVDEIPTNHYDDDGNDYTPRSWTHDWGKADEPTDAWWGPRPYQGTERQSTLATTVSDLMKVHCCRMNGYKQEFRFGIDARMVIKFNKGAESHWGSNIGSSTGAVVNKLGPLGKWAHWSNTDNFGGLSMGLGGTLGGLAMSTYTVTSSMDIVINHNFQTPETDILVGYHLDRDTRDQILYPRENTSEYDEFDEYDIIPDSYDTSQNVKTFRNSGSKENGGPKEDGTIVLSVPHNPGHAWIIRDPRETWLEAPDDDDLNSAGRIYSSATRVVPATHSVSIGVGEIKMESNDRYRVAYIVPRPEVLSGYLFTYPPSYQGWTFNHPEEDYLTGRTGDWWYRSQEDTKSVRWHEDMYLTKWGFWPPDDLPPSYYPAAPDLRDRPLVWANLNWGDQGIYHYPEDSPSEGRRYKAAIIQWGRATAGYEDGYGNYGEYESGKEQWCPSSAGAYLCKGVGWLRAYQGGDDTEPPAEADFDYGSNANYWANRRPIDAEYVTTKDRAGNIIEYDDFDNAKGTVIEYFLCVAGAEQGTGSGHGTFEMPIWAAHVQYWGDPTERDQESDYDPKPRTDLDVRGDECWYWGLYIEREVLIWFERLGDRSDPDINNIVHHPGALPPADVDHTHLSPRLPDAFYLMESLDQEQIGGEDTRGISIGWRMHSLNKTTGDHYTLDTEWLHPDFWERTQELGYPDDQKGTEPQKFFPEVRGISDNHIYVEGFLLTDTRDGLEKGFFTRWVMSHDLTWMWPVGEIVSGPDPESIDYPNGQWIGGSFAGRVNYYSAPLPRGSQGHDVVKVEDGLSPTLEQYPNRIPTITYGDGSDLTPS